MQFYLDGYRPGDPFVAEPDPVSAGRGAELPDTADVLIVGCGPAGLVLAAQLARFPDIHTVIIDRKDGPLEVGQADGVACRTVEMFEAFGLADELIREGYQVNEVSFWGPDEDDPSRIVRTGRVEDVEDGISEMPHMIVNQARMLTYLREDARRSPTRLEPHYGLHLAGVAVSDGDEYPVTATLEHLVEGDPTGATSTLRARYVVGCDGSRSSTREAIGRRLVGDAMNQSWGVLDVLAVTDFPDIRLKSVIRSQAGSILVIPREGGYLVRLYIELDNDRDAAMLRDRSVSPAALADVANRILHPFTVDVREVGWWAVYEVGQRLCDSFDDVGDDEIDGRIPRVFIAGDACHTHSAKAGQGMNVSMADTWNLGWKLAAVLRGQSPPQLLHTYSAERREVARRLIEFDREFAGRFSARSGDDRAGDDRAGDFAHYFREQGRFTAGVSVRYTPSMIVGPSDHQYLAKGFPIGMRFHSAPVLRLADAKPLHLGHVARADGAWRLYVFADPTHPSRPGSRVRRLCEFLDSDASPTATVPGRYADRPDALLDVRAVFQQGHRELSVHDLPAALLPRKGRHGLVDHEKAFCPDPRAGDVFDLRGVDRAAGAMVLVRPDQYVALVLPLDAHTELAEFLAGVFVQGPDRIPATQDRPPTRRRTHR